jgi:hypothetical protein
MALLSSPVLPAVLAWDWVRDDRRQDQRSAETRALGNSTDVSAEILRLHAGVPALVIDLIALASINNGAPSACACNMAASITSGCAEQIE